MKKKKKVNRQYRDRLFKIIFGEEERKLYTLHLYNALNDSHYTNVNDLKLVTLEDVFYVGMKNDVSFILSSKLNLYEQQSSINPNMPLRMTLYFFEQINRYIKEEKLDLYTSSVQFIPAPQFIVFYNGREPFPERKRYRLSNAYLNHQKGDLEAKVMVYNINGRNNLMLKKKCPELLEYSWFIDEIERKRKEGLELNEAVDQVIDKLPTNFILKEFLIKNRSLVMNALFMEYDKEDYKKTGYKDGIYDGKREVAINMINRNYPIHDVIDITGLSIEAINQLRKEIN